MGGGGKKAHESFVVSPSAPATTDAMVVMTAQDLAAVADPDGPAASTMASLDTAVATAADAEDFSALADATTEASGLLVAAADAGVPPQLLADADKALKATTKAHLGAMSAEELTALATSKGFEHPELVGLSTSGGGTHPLVHWLDPAYPSTAPSKLAIQAKAAERYATLSAGDTIGGLVLADLDTAQGEEGAPPPAGSWTATPAEVVMASADVHQALADFSPHGPSYTTPPSDRGLGALVTAENKVTTAHCPELGSDLDIAKGAAKASVDKALAGLYGSAQSQAVAQVVAAAQGAGTISEAEAKYLGPADQLALLRSSTSPTEQAALKDQAVERAAQLATLSELKAAFGAYDTGPSLGLGAVDTPEGKAAAVAFAQTAGAYTAQRSKVASWASQVAASGEVKAVSGQPWSQAPSELTQKFRTWAKTQKLSDLRSVANSMGMSGDGASRAHVQNFIASSWDPSIDKAAVTASTTAAAAKKAAAPKPVKPTSSAAAATPVVPGASAPVPTGPPPPKSFATKHLQIIEALKAHQALAADLPARVPAGEVASWSFGPAQAANLGGGHAKTIHAAPDGSAWMFKPDKTGGGARAHAEAQASAIFAQVGVPSVPVYARAMGTKVGSIQPLVKGATQMSPQPSSWSQAEVDGVVRYHVAAWAVGDHDGGPANMIRTPSGGLCPVDQGQAFKFFGRDRLDAGYHPNSSFGSVPVFHQTYAAAKADGLAPGVHVRPEAALPVIKAFEAIPDAQYRAMLAPVAAEGVKGGLHWVEPMRTAAQKRLGKAQVSDTEVAEEFLRTAVARKNGLRGAFASFFTANGFAAGAKLEKVA